MSPQEIIKDRTFIQQQVEQTTYDLFHAKSVREAQFLQQKLTYLKKRMREAKTAEKPRK